MFLNISMQFIDCLFPRLFSTAASRFGLTNMLIKCRQDAAKVHDMYITYAAF